MEGSGGQGEGAGVRAGRTGVRVRGGSAPTASLGGSSSRL